MKREQSEEKGFRIGDHVRTTRYYSSTRYAEVCQRWCISVVKTALERQGEATSEEKLKRTYQVERKKPMRGIVVEIFSDMVGIRVPDDYYDGRGARIRLMDEYTLEIDPKPLPMDRYQMTRK
jgi:hypothetical protein